MNKKILIISIFIVVVIGIISVVHISKVCGHKELLDVEGLEVTVISDKVSYVINDVIDEAKSYEPSIQVKIISACKKYGVNSSIALAIAELETGHFTSDAYIYSNNVGGLLTSKGICTYNTVEDGIDAFVRTLHNIGTEDIDVLAQIYCPHNPVGWANEVRKLMR